jgi:TetR/AcrR family transcriptional regulator of autoinduction and epiphytic fitness
MHLFCENTMAKLSQMTKRQTPSPATRKRLQDERIAELLDVAAEVFIAEGFAAASINEIARRANASKATFYSRFPTKQDLFLAVIDRRMSNVFEQVANFPDEGTLKSSLERFCTNLLSVALSPKQISLIRMVSMESGRYPALARRFYEHGPKQGEKALANYLSQQTAKGLLGHEDPLVMARQLINLITGSPIRWFVLGFDAAPMGKRALQRHIDESISLFLRAYGTSQGRTLD